MAPFRRQWRSGLRLIPLIGPDGGQWLPAPLEDAAAPASAVRTRRPAFAIRFRARRNN